MSKSERNRQKLTANETLYQLSYTPARCRTNYHDEQILHHDAAQAAAASVKEADVGWNERSGAGRVRISRSIGASARTERGIIYGDLGWWRRDWLLAFSLE